ncbi:hypothetical protein A1D29_00815 [Pasteurellaceae bacterium Orientalotternb1]|nr:hypothetical protein A1D29_00815 [Pasteurellaceae bacterium Orientalotternb1]
MKKIYLFQFFMFFIMTFFSLFIFSNRTLINAIVGSFIGSTVYIVSFHFISQWYAAYKEKN